jgi:hypothetical protein
MSGQRCDALRKWTLVVPDPNRDRVISFDMERADDIARPDSVIFTIDAQAVEEWKSTDTDHQGK